MVGGDDYENMPYDIIRKIALEKNLSYKDIVSQCLISTTFNEAICNNEEFWSLIVKRDYPSQKIEKNY